MGLEFKKFYVENEAADQVEDLFGNAMKEVSKLFDELFGQLYDAMKRTWGNKQPMPSSQATSVINALKGIIAKLQGDVAGTPDVAQPAQRRNIQREECFKDINNLLAEASAIAAGLKPVPDGTYNIKQVLANIKSQILQKFMDLRDQLLHTKLMAAINDVPGKVANRMQVQMDPESSWRIKDNYTRLAQLGKVDTSMDNAMYSTGGIVTFTGQDGQPRKIDLKDPNAIDDILAAKNPPGQTDYSKVAAVPQPVRKRSTANRPAYGLGRK